MSIHDYMRQGPGGQVSMMLNNLPQFCFIDAVRTKNIYKARILTRVERGNLENPINDIELTSPWNSKEYISRKQFSENFIHANGRKIRLAFMNSGKSYVVMSSTNENYKVIKLPDNCVGIFNNKKVKPGSYLICKATEDGQADLSTLGIVSPKIFRKMFRIPPQDIINRHRGSGGKNLTLFSRDRKSVRVTLNSTPNVMSNANSIARNTNNRITPRIDTSELGINPSSINIPTVNNALKNQLNRGSLIRNSNATNDNNGSSESKYKLTTVNRIVDMNGKLQGFTVKSLQSGELKRVTIPQMSKLCASHYVDNIILAKRESTGTTYLKGNGIIINNLPEVIM